MLPRGKYTKQKSHAEILQKQKSGTKCQIGSKKSKLGMDNEIQLNTKTKIMDKNVDEVSDSSIDQKQKKTQLASGIFQAENSPKGSEMSESLVHYDDVGKNSSPMDYEPVLNSDNSFVKPEMVGEVTRLKQLLLLQVSLISRQQDLLRLRDRELMQLKATNQNYKSQLHRVRRRMSSHKEMTWGEILSSTPPKKKCELGVMTETNAVGVKDDSEIDAVNLLYSTMRKIAQEKDASVFKCEDISDADMNEKMMEGNAQQSMKLNSTLPSIVEVPATETNESLTSKKVASDSINDINQIRICSMCPYCINISEKMTKFIRTKNEYLLGSSDVEILQLAHIAIFNAGDKDYQEIPIMRTPSSYFHSSINFSEDHWWWDLQCDSIATDDMLNIPSWTSVDLPIQTSSLEEPDENMDDVSFTRRHNKYEIDEKRRKLWDIRRIREYRYNEKLRQKLLKQAALFDAPVIETFAGQLHDAESVEVQENLPINVFGYPAPHYELEEFTLGPMYQLPKVPSNGKQKMQLEAMK